MTKNEIAVAMDVTYLSVERWINDGLKIGKERVRLKSTKVNGRVHIEKSDFTDFMKIREGLK